LGPADRVERAAGLRDGLVPLRRRIAPPRDAATDVEAQATAVCNERPDEDARRHRAIGADPAERSRVRPAPNRLEALEDLHRTELRGAADRAAGERGREQVEWIAPEREAAGHGRDEVLDGGGPLESAQAGHADGARRAHAAQVVAEDVDDHRVLGPI